MTVNRQWEINLTRTNTQTDLPSTAHQWLSRPPVPCLSESDKKQRLKAPPLKGNRFIILRKINGRLLPVTDMCWTQAYFPLVILPAANSSMCAIVAPATDGLQ